MNSEGETNEAACYRASEPGVIEACTCGWGGGPEAENWWLCGCDPCEPRLDNGDLIGS